MALGVTVDFNANVAKFTKSVDKIGADLSRFEKQTKKTAKATSTTTRKSVHKIYLTNTLP